MNKGFLYKYFLRNALHSYLFWFVFFMVGFFLVLPFIITMVMIIGARNSEASEMVGHMIQSELNMIMAFLGMVLSPALGIVAGKTLVARESEMLLAQEIPRRDFYFTAFAFHSLFLIFLWLVFSALYLFVSVYYSYPIDLNLILGLVFLLLGILIPFLWVGFFAINFRPVAVVIIFIGLYLMLPSIASALNEHGKYQGIIKLVGEIITIMVPRTDSFGEMNDNSNPFSQGLAYRNYLKSGIYGLLWIGFLLWTGLKVYRNKDLTDPQG